MDVKRNIFVETIKKNGAGGVEVSAKEARKGRPHNDAHNTLDRVLDLIFTSAYRGFKPIMVVELTEKTAVVEQEGLGSTEGLDSSYF